jgi:hypothetical protein
VHKSETVAAQAIVPEVTLADGVIEGVDEIQSCNDPILPPLT